MKVIVGYTATAGFSVLIIIGYYFLAHQPGLDPFRSDSDDAETGVPHNPHPIDKLVLDYSRKIMTKISVRTTENPAKGGTRLENALLKVKQNFVHLQR